MTFLKSRNNRIIFMLCISISQPIFFWYTFEIMMNAVCSNFHFSVLNFHFDHFLRYFAEAAQRFCDTPLWLSSLCFGNVLGLLELLQMLSGEKFLEKKGVNLFLMSPSTPKLCTNKKATGFLHNCHQPF